MYAVDATHRWMIEAPVDTYGMFDLRGLPTGATPVLGTRGAAGDGERHVFAGADHRALYWPSGQAVEVIVRSASLDDDARVWIVRRGLQARTRGELETVLGGSGRTLAWSDIATAPLRPIGAANSDAGREHYRAGDRHAIITGNHTGSVTACAAAHGGADTPLRCASFSVEPSIERKLTDRRVATGITPIVLEL